jgi:hypothetical protein
MRKSLCILASTMFLAAPALAQSPQNTMTAAPDSQPTT